MLGAFDTQNTEFPLQDALAPTAYAANYLNRHLPNIQVQLSCLPRPKRWQSIKESQKLRISYKNTKGQVSRFVNRVTN